MTDIVRFVGGPKDGEVREFRGLPLLIEFAVEPGVRVGPNDALPDIRRGRYRKTTETVEGAWLYVIDIDPTKDGAAAEAEAKSIPQSPSPPETEGKAR